MMKKLLLFLIIGMFMISFVSAFEIDNIGNFDKDIGKYGKYEIRNSVLGLSWLQYGKVADLELKSNSDVCGENCFAEKEITIYEDGALVDDVRFYTIDGDRKYLQQIRNYEFFIQTGKTQVKVDDYKIQTNIIGTSPNGTQIKENKKVKIGSYFEEYPKWTKYNMGDIMPSGTYILKLEGEKKQSRTVDWQIKSNGIWTKEWSIWGGSGNLLINLTSYYKLDNSSGVVFDMQGNNDGTNIGATRGIIGKINNAFNFSSNSITGVEDVRGWQNGTITYWFNTTTISGIQDIYSTHAGGSDSKVGLNGNKTYISRQGSWILESSSIISVNTWYMATFVWNNTGEYLYLNGILEDSSSVGSGWSSTGAAAIIGARAGVLDETYSGLLDEVGFWNKSLTESEIRSLYSTGNGISYNRFNVSSIILNSPVDGLLSSTNLNTFSVTATVLNGATLVNMSLYTNETESRSEEHTSELQSHSFISYAVFCLKKKTSCLTLVRRANK